MENIARVQTALNSQFFPSQVGPGPGQCHGHDQGQGQGGRSGQGLNI